MNPLQDTISSPQLERRPFRFCVLGQGGPGSPSRSGEPQKLLPAGDGDCDGHPPCWLHQTLPLFPGPSQNSSNTRLILARNHRSACWTMAKSRFRGFVGQSAEKGRRQQVRPRVNSLQTALCTCSLCSPGCVRPRSQVHLGGFSSPRYTLLPRGVSHSAHLCVGTR